MQVYPDIQTCSFTGCSDTGRRWEDSDDGESCWLCKAHGAEIRKMQRNDNHMLNWRPAGPAIDNSREEL